MAQALGNAPAAAATAFSCKPQPTYGRLFMDIGLMNAVSGLGWPATGHGRMVWLRRGKIGCTLPAVTLP